MARHAGVAPAEPVHVAMAVDAGVVVLRRGGPAVRCTVQPALCGETPASPAHGEGLSGLVRVAAPPVALAPVSAVAASAPPTKVATSAGMKSRRD